MFENCLNWRPYPRDLKPMPNNYKCPQFSSELRGTSVSWSIDEIIGGPPGHLNLYQMSRSKVGAWVALRMIILLRTKWFFHISSRVTGDTWCVTRGQRCIHLSSKITGSPYAQDTWMWCSCKLSWPHGHGAHANWANTKNDSKHLPLCLKLRT